MKWHDLSVKIHDRPGQIQVITCGSGMMEASATRASTGESVFIVSLTQP
jgi:hypothetical protein